MTDLSKIDRADNVGNPQMGWASDVAAEMLRRMGIKYLAMNPGASYRGFHDSIVNYLGNRDPQLLLCLLPMARRQQAGGLAAGCVGFTRGDSLDELAHSPLRRSAGELGNDLTVVVGFYCWDSLHTKAHGQARVLVHIHLGQ